MSEIIPQENMLNLLMSRNPLELTDDDIAQVCKELRKQYAEFVVKEQVSSKKISAPVNLDLTDLGL